MANNPDPADPKPAMACLPVLLMTRPRSASERFVTELRAAGARFDPVISPVMQVVPLGQLPDMDRVEGLIFTSAQGVARYAALGGPMRQSYAVGAATAQAARDAGLPVMSADGDASALVAMIQGAAPTGVLLHVRGRHSRGEVAQNLREAGIETQDVVVYDQILQTLSDAAQQALMTRRVVCPVFSPRSAAHLATQAGSAHDLNIVAMSPAVAAEMTDLAPGKLAICPRPETGAMLRATLDLLD